MKTLLTRSALAAFFAAGSVVSTPEESEAAYRGYTFTGCTKDKKSVSQEFKWNMGLGQATIQSQSSAVKSSFAHSVKKFTSAQIKGNGHLASVLTGNVKKDGSVTFNPAKFGKAC